jgi:hypothetical protein
VDFDRALDADCPAHNGTKSFLFCFVAADRMELAKPPCIGYEGISIPDSSMASINLFFMPLAQRPENDRVKAVSVSLEF